ncbi:unnamed protein product [Prorocentrum cordatum]|uniref:Uncharacterized protein n=1 Tax=Prorocentrum cordatum TaxID=2364126 RepID=A0ABN9R063_9DINO|nr:unnamed protein product [Polarella glacialis]
MSTFVDDVKKCRSDKLASPWRHESHLAKITLKLEDSLEVVPVQTTAFRGPQKYRGLAAMQAAVAAGPKVVRAPEYERLAAMRAANAKGTKVFPARQPRQLSPRPLPKREFPVSACPRPGPIAGMNGNNATG